MGERAARMRRAVVAAVRAGGSTRDDVEAVGRALDVAMAPRIDQLADDHHPAYLHPGRTALVLLRDVGDVDPTVLSVGVLHESGDAPLRVPEEQIAEVLGPSLAVAVASIPLPGDERLIERLVDLEPGIVLAALAERLDHVRHLHVREDLVDRWTDVYREVEHAWLPLATRVHPVLARRYAHWTRRFAERIAKG